MATMTLSPTSAAPGTAITVTGSGFANNAKTKVAVESVPILTFKASNSGSFTKTIYAPSGANRNVAIVATCYIGHSWVVVATATLAIVNVGPPVDTTKPTITSGPTVGSITQTSATIAWSLSESANGQIEFGLTEGPPYGSVSTKENGYLPSHSQNLSGLTAGRTYYYRVHSVDAAGNGVYSAANATFQTAAADPVYTPPSAPASLTATAGNNLVDLAWTAPASNGGTAITGYRIYRGGTSLITLGNVLTYQNTGLVNNQLYSYQVTAINAAGLEGPPSVSRSATPGDTTPPTVSGIAHSNVTQTTASVSWSINEPATGQVQYGLTAAYDLTTTLETSLLLGHAQELTGLTPGMVYHYRAKSLDEAGNPGYSNDRSFETVWVAPPLPVFYGPGVGYETKANERLDGGKQSYRFRASQTSNAVSVAVNVRTGVDYSLGTGGTVKVSIRSDSGGNPSNTILGSVTWSPGNPGTAENKAHRTFMSSIPLVAGTVYHLVTENTHPSPTANYVSVNVVLAWNPANTPRQPAFSDDFAVLRNTGSWALQSGYLAVFDLLYANGQHDGNMYFAVITGQEGYISGTSNMVRARFTVSGGTRTVSGAFVQVRRNSGTGALVVRLEQSDGTLIESVSVAAAGIAVVGATDVQSAVAWTAVPFVSNRTLTNGQTYNLRLSCAAGTTYSVMPLRWSDSDMAAWNGYHFRDGAGDNGSSGQETTNGGSSWADLYGDAPSDFGLYFGVV